MAALVFRRAGITRWRFSTTSPPFPRSSGTARLLSHTVTLPATTERLRFDWWEDVDPAFAHSLWSDGNVMQFIGGPQDEAQVAARLVNQRKTRSECGVQYWPIFLREGNDFVGCCGLKPRTDTPQLTYELGFHLVQDYWGRRLATEAATSVIAYAFGPLGADALFAGHRPTNESSRKAILRLGFVFDYEELYVPTGLIHPRYKLTAQIRPCS